MAAEAPKDPTRRSHDVTADFSHTELSRLGETKAGSSTFPGDDEERAERRNLRASAPIRLGAYEILAELGRGGMGVVYHAHDMKLKRDVAIKVVLAGGHAGKVEFARFQTEAEAVARLKHPNVVQVYEIGEDRGLPFLALEYCPGGSLEDRLENSPPNFRESAELMATLANAVAHAHDANIIHRDLKPGNVLFDADGTPKLTDFGLAKKVGDDDSYTRTGSVLGSAAYMSPEQASGNTRDVTPAADIYALGAMLYRLLAGRTVFSGKSDLETIQLIVTGAPPAIRRFRPNCPRDLETIALKCLEKQPAARYSTAGDLAADLQRFLRGEPIQARPATPLEQLTSWARRNRLATAVALLSIVMLAALAGVLAWMSYRNYQALEQIHTREMRVQELRGQILYLDEVLTASASLSAYSGDEKWRDRYRAHEPQLTAALEEAIALVPESKDELTAVEAANTALVKLEAESLDFAAAGQSAAAQALLSGDTYTAQKTAYTRGLTAFAAQLQEHSNAAITAARQEATRFLLAAAILGGAVLAILLLGAYTALRAFQHHSASQ